MGVHFTFAVQAVRIAYRVTPPPFARASEKGLLQTLFEASIQSLASMPGTRRWIIRKRELSLWTLK